MASKVLTITVFFSAILAVALASRSDFETWRKLFGKKYSSIVEYEHRFNVWKVCVTGLVSLLSFRQNNAKYVGEMNKLSTGARFEMNEFSDLSPLVRILPNSCTGHHSCLVGVPQGASYVAWNTDDSN